MSLHRLKIDKFGRLAINGKSVSGVVTSVMVDGNVVWKEQTLLLASGNEKVFNGFGDSAITLSLKIYESLEGRTNRFKALKTVNDAFKAVEDKKAVCYSLEGDVFGALSLKEAFFDTINTVTVDDSFLVTIALKENNPAVSKVQDQQATASEAEKPEAEFTGMSDAEKAKLARLEGVYN